MNRTIALLIPAILLVAMTLIVFQQFSSPSDDELVPEQMNAQSNQTTQVGALSDPERIQPSNQDADRPGGFAGQSQTQNQAQTQSQPGPDQQTAAPDNNEVANTQANSQPSTGTGADQAAKPQDKPQDKPADKPAEPASKHKVESMKFEYQGNEILFILNADSEFEYRAFALNSPERVVVDLIGDWSGVESINVPSNRLISGMRNGKTERGYRLVFDLKEAPKGHESKRDGKKLTLRVY